MTYDIDFTTFTYGGDTLGRLPDGRAVFVPFVLPGERARIRLVEDKRNFARGEVVELLQPSPDRITPRCVHFARCGGCHYQHLPIQRQLEVKQSVLRDQLTRIAGIAEPPVRPIQPSPLAWNYRNVLQFHLSAEGKLGFQAAGGAGVMPVQECHLPLEAIAQVWPQLDLEPVPGLERVALRAGAEDDLMLVLESQELQAPELSVEELPLSVVHLGPAGPLVLAGSDALLMQVMGRVFRVSAASFFQVNLPVAEAMLQHVLSLLPETPGQTILDLYCGVGLFSAFLAPRAARLIGVELSESACNDFAANLDEFDNVELYQGAAGDVLPGLKLRPDAVVVDPPRAGLEKPALDALLTLRSPRLVYVSCDPSTLARDIKRLLAGGYRLTQATPFDMFPQTYHMETIALLEWEGGANPQP